MQEAEIAAALARMESQNQQQEASAKVSVSHQIRPGREGRAGREGSVVLQADLARVAAESRAPQPSVKRMVVRKSHTTADGRVTEEEIVGSQVGDDLSVTRTHRVRKEEVSRIFLPAFLLFRRCETEGIQMKALDGGKKTDGPKITEME